MAVWSFISYRQLPYFRLDPEYYQPRYLSLHETLTKAQAVPIQKFAFVTDGIHSSPEWVDEGGVTYLSAKCVKDNFIDVSNAGKISRSQNSANPRTQARIDDVLITSVGTIGNAAVVDADILPANMDRHLGIIRVRADSGVDPYYLATFLNCEYGRFQSMRESTGNVQLNLFIEKIKTILVPIGDHYNRVGQITRQAYQKRKEAHSLYQQAQTQLLESLGLYNFDLSHQVAYTANFNDAVSARRLDAEYFQPKYYRLLERLLQTGMCVRLGDWVREEIRRGVQPLYAEEGEITVVNSQHVGKTHIELDDNRKTTSAFQATGRNRRAQIQREDVLLNSTGYITIGRCQTMLSDVPAMVDGHVSIIRLKDGLDPVYLGLYLNSLPGQMQTERGWTGSSGQIELRPETIRDFAVWKAPVEIQMEIRHLVEQANAARESAKQLLDEAKKQVEQQIQEAA